MQILTLVLVLVMVKPLCYVASLGELVSGVPLRPWITFHMSEQLTFDIEFCRSFFQLLFLASLMASFASRHISIQSCRFWWMVRWRQLRLQMFARLRQLVFRYNCWIWKLIRAGYLCGWTDSIVSNLRLSHKSNPHNANVKILVVVSCNCVTSARSSGTLGYW